MVSNLVYRLSEYFNNWGTTLKAFIRTRLIRRPGNHRKPLNDIYADLSDKRTFYAWQRNHMANERTFLAWCRTGISMIVFSFVIERFDLMIRELRIFSNNPTLAQHVAHGHYMGMGIFILGSGIIMLAGWRFFYIRKHINMGDIEFSALPDIFLMVSVLLTFIMTFIFFAYLY